MARRCDISARVYISLLRGRVSEGYSACMTNSIHNDKRGARAFRLGAIEREVLEELSAADLFIGFLCSARSTRRMYKVARERAMHRYRTRLAIERLTRRGLVRKSGETAFITDAGSALIDNAIEKTRRVLKTRTWDRKWRIVSYDIPEKYKQLRDRIRLILKRAGFVKLQHSLWIFPHECEELTQVIKKEKKLKEYIVYGVLERIENDHGLKAHFSL